MNILFRRLLWGASAVLAVFCVVLLARRLSLPASLPQGGLLESAKAPPLRAPAVPIPPVSDWLAGWFAAPLAPQGPAPHDWSAIEADLSAKACGACHVQQFLDWKESWHALGMGPGVAGQLLGAEAAALAPKCQRCHAPLAEQVGAGPAETALRGEGLSCAGCHVRAWARAGPPLPPGTPAMTDAPHGGFVPRDEFQDGQFCASCHDFSPGQKALEGKLLQETWAEWSRTAYARDGVSCQDCHMEGGRHLWKGVHDPDMVRRAFTASVAWERQGGTLRGTLVVTNTGAGHRLPTYSTPQLTLRMEQLDAAGAALPDTRTEGAIARRLRPDLKEELFDTRLLPGESHTLEYALALAPGAVAVRATVECWPDEGYRRFYAIEAEDPTRSEEARALLRTALARTEGSRFVAWEHVGSLP